MKKDGICYIDNRSMIYEGSKKIVFNDHKENTHILYFKDSLTLKALSPDPVLIDGKGIVNNALSSYIFHRLNEYGFPTHFIAKQNIREQIVYALEILPFVVKVRNAASDFLVKDMGLEEGSFFSSPMVEFYAKLEGMETQQMLSRDHLEGLGMAMKTEISDIISLALRTNDFLLGFFGGLGLTLYDVNFSFGRRYNYLLDDMDITLADEISPDTCHLADSISQKKYGIYGVRSGNAPSIDLYQEILDRCPYAVRSPLGGVKNTDSNSVVVQLADSKKPAE